MKKKPDTVRNIEFFDRVAIANRDLRRRFSSGVIFLVLVLLGIYAIPGIPEMKTVISSGLKLILNENQLINSIAGMAFLVSAVFIVGNIIEAIGETLLNFCFKRININKQNYLDKNFSKEASRVFKFLPKPVKEGLQKPYGRNFDLAFRYLIHVTQVEQKVWMHELECRNKNLLNMLSSIFFGSVFVFCLAVIFGIQLNSYLPKDKDCVRNIISIHNSFIISHGGVVDDPFFGDYFIDEEYLSGNAISIDSVNEFRRQLKRGLTRNIELLISDLDRETLNDYSDAMEKIDSGINTCFVPGFPVKTIVFGTIFFILLLICLGLVYSSTVRNSISIALETISIPNDSLDKTNLEDD